MADSPDTRREKATFNALHRTISQGIGPNHHLTLRAAVSWKKGWIRGTRYLEGDNIIKVNKGGTHKCYKLSERGKLLIRYCIIKLVKDFNREQYRKFSLKLVWAKVNEEKHCKFSMSAEVRYPSQSQLERLYEKSLLSFKKMICNEILKKETQKMPVDLQHLFQFLTDYRTFWEHHQMLPYHPCLWDKYQFEQKVFALNTRSYRLGERDLFYNSQILRTFPWKNSLRRDFLHDNDWNDAAFKDIAKEVWNYKLVDGGRYRDDANGLLLYVRDFLEHCNQHNQRLTGQYLTDKSMCEKLREWLMIYHRHFLSDLVNVAFSKASFKCDCQA